MTAESLNGKWDEGEKFKDIGNGEWSEAEPLKDLNKNNDSNKNIKKKRNFNYIIKMKLARFKIRI